MQVLKFCQARVSEMTQWVKAPETKPDDLNLIPGTHAAEE